MGIEHRGFATMDPELRRRICSKGGIAAHKKGNAHEWDSEGARKAGQKGGSATQARRRIVVDEQKAARKIDGER